MAVAVELHSGAVELARRPRWSCLCDPCVLVAASATAESQTAAPAALRPLRPCALPLPPCDASAALPLPADLILRLLIATFSQCRV